MRLVASGLALAVAVWSASACSRTIQVESTARPTVELDLRALDALVLPAGLYARMIGGHSDLVSAGRGCTRLPGADCAAPSVALVAGAFDDLGQLEQARDARVGAAFLAPGYPFVAHGDQLGIQGGGRYLVIGLFESPRQLAAWRDQLRAAGHEGALTDFTELDLTVADTEIAGADRVLVELDTPLETVAAWARADVDLGKGQVLGLNEVAGLTPACTHSGRAVFETSASEIADYTFSDWVPLTCPDGTPAVVPRDWTLLDAVTESCTDCAEPRAAHRSRLLTTACGAPSFALQQLAADGTVVREEHAIGCGAGTRDVTGYRGARPVCDEDWLPTGTAAGQALTPVHVQALYPSMAMERATWLPAPASDCAAPPPADCTAASDRPECSCAHTCYAFAVQLGAHGDVTDIALEVFDLRDPSGAPVASTEASVPTEAGFCAWDPTGEPIPIWTRLRADTGGGCVGLTVTRTD